jgi:membrane protein
MAPTALAKRLFRTLARVIPQCGMVAQAVAFNMFLAFFAVLLIGLSLLKGSLEGASGPDLARRLSAILPPGSWQLVSALVPYPEVKSWYLALAGWIGALFVGSQVIKLIITGIEMIYGERDSHSFLVRQIRSLLLFLLASVAWLLATVVSVFGGPLSDWITARLGGGFTWIGFVLLPFLAMILAMFVLALIYRLASPVNTTWHAVFPGAACATALWWGLNILFGIYVRKTQLGPLYGGLAAVIGLMTWMDISATFVFLGAAWNSEGTSQHDRP